MMNVSTFTAATLLVAAGLGVGTAAAADRMAETIDRGRYLVTVSGCNDCHTPRYLEKDGKVPESQWLTGASVGFQGPWGTTYPTNLRLLVSTMTESQWLKRARTPMMPPMPWFNLQKMTDDDLRAVFRYVRSLGPKGEPAPVAAAPGASVKTPYYVFVPQNLPRQARTR
jgi:mono/diheme cytochrome c family protein